MVSERTMELAIAKARSTNVAALTVVRQAHVGRVADYPLMAARAGMIAWMFCDSGRTAKQVAPFGGREARLGTNPLSIAIPSDLEAPIFLDMATSGVAGGKVSVAKSRGQRLPEGLLIDRDDQVERPADAARSPVELEPDVVRRLRVVPGDVEIDPDRHQELPDRDDDIQAACSVRRD